MANDKGFTLVEIVVVLVIVGILVAMALPNLAAYVERSRAGTAKNNLLAIAAGQVRYYQDQVPNAYCTAACPDYSSINTNLHLSISPQSDPFVYNCSSGPVVGCAAAYYCTATYNNLTLTLCITDPLQPVSCSPQGDSRCPS